MSFCNNCGTELLESVAYCSKCGAATTTIAGSGSNRNKTKGGMSTVLIVILVVLGVMALFIGTIATIAVPQLLEARRNSNERSAIGKLRAFSTDQETYKADNTTYTTIEKLEGFFKLDLRNVKQGYVLVDLMKEPNADYYAVLASPVEWSKTGRKHFVITNEGVVRVCLEQELPFPLSLPANQASIDTINKLKEAR